ncbi:LOW QUALITY PROTEIN: hypothetical protein PanWU01x14_338940, partial [Parasponia andersonii]
LTGLKQSNPYWSYVKCLSFASPSNHGYHILTLDLYLLLLDQPSQTCCLLLSHICNSVGIIYRFFPRFWAVVHKGSSPISC